MPFTLSHPAVVLGLGRFGLPMTGLTVGSMIPDLPMFGIVPYGYGFAHSLIGIVTVDLVAGIAAVAVWTVLVQGVVISASPQWLRDRITDSPLAGRRWALLAPAVVLGAVTHVVWDAFTHDGRWGVRHIGWLSSDHLGHAGYHWAQAASSVVGLVVVMAYSMLALKRTPSHPRRAAAVAVARWNLAVVATCAVGVGFAYLADQFDGGLHAAAIAAATHAIGVGIIGVVVAGCIWRYAAQRAIQA